MDGLVRDRHCGMRDSMCRTLTPLKSQLKAITYRQKSRRAKRWMMSELAVARSQIEFARSYTNSLLEPIPTSEWFRQPSEGVTHVAWQVGHLAMAQYRMALERIRGRQDDDEQLISESFLQHFGKGSVPDPDPAKNPSIEEIRSVYESMYRQVLTEMEHVAASDLESPPVKEHKIAKTKLACFFWAANHELIHAGQIALLRRLLGQSPLPR